MGVSSSIILPPIHQTSTEREIDWPVVKTFIYKEKDLDQRNINMSSAILFNVHKQIRKRKKIVTIKDIKKEIKHLYEHPLTKMYRTNPIQTYCNILIFSFILIVVFGILIKLYFRFKIRRGNVVPNEHIELPWQSHVISKS